jgi:hypothetical protein
VSSYDDPNLRGNIASVWKWSAGAVYAVNPLDKDKHEHIVTISLKSYDAFNNICTSKEEDEGCVLLSCDCKFDIVSNTVHYKCLISDSVSALNLRDTIKNISRLYKSAGLFEKQCDHIYTVVNTLLGFHTFNFRDEEGWDRANSQLYKLWRRDEIDFSTDRSIIKSLSDFPSEAVKIHWHPVFDESFGVSSRWNNIVGFSKTDYWAVQELHEKGYYKCLCAARRSNAQWKAGVGSMCSHPIAKNLSNHSSAEAELKYANASYCLLRQSISLTSICFRIFQFHST